MAHLNRTCKVCDTKYSYCPSCEEDIDYPKWMAMFHDERCKKIWETLIENSCGRLSDKETMDFLVNECDINHFQANEHISAYITDLRKRTRKTVTPKTTTKANKPTENKDCEK